jgi:predicted RNA binding protein YcfA (HicA-like mRNA interferase family)
MMPRKIRQFKKDLKDLGFTSRSGKGRHQVWNHPLLIKPIVISEKDGADVPGYLEKDLKAAIKELKEERD